VFDLGPTVCVPARADTSLPPPPRTLVELSCPSFPVVPGYKLLEELGRGGMGVVLRARDPDLDRDLAVKVPWSVTGIGPTWRGASVRRHA